MAVELRDLFVGMLPGFVEAGLAVDEPVGGVGWGPTYGAGGYRCRSGPVPPVVRYALADQPLGAMEK